MNTRCTRAALSIAAVIALAACSDDPQLADVTTIAPPPTVAVTSAPASEASSATTTGVTEVTDPAVTSSAPATSADATVPGDPTLTGPTFSDALGVKVDTAPGVNTPGDTRQLLPEGLYVHIAWTADPNDPSVFTARDEDIEILEAYANAVAAYYLSATTDLSASTDELLRFVVDPTAMFGKAFSQAAEGNLVLDLGAGVVLRPYVVDYNGSSATVYDCYLQDEQYVLRNTTREPSSLKSTGQVATLVSINGAWKVDTAGLLGSACL